MALKPDGTSISISAGISFKRCARLFFFYVVCRPSHSCFVEIRFICDLEIINRQFLSWPFVQKSSCDAVFFFLVYLTLLLVICNVFIGNCMA